MVLACKVFELKEPLTPILIVQKLKDFKYTSVEVEDGEEIELLTQVTDLKMEEDSVEGVLTEDFLITVRFRDEEKRIPVTRKTRFQIVNYESRIFIIIVDKKERANRIANILSEILTGIRGNIVECRIGHETLKALHEANPEATKVIFFDNVDIPNVDKLSLYGASVADTSLYNEYLKHGKIWYVVFRDKDNVVVGITRNCVVTIFSKVSMEDMFNYIRGRIIPLIE